MFRLVVRFSTAPNHSFSTAVHLNVGMVVFPVRHALGHNVALIIGRYSLILNLYCRSDSKADYLVLTVVETRL